MSGTSDSNARVARALVAILAQDDPTAVPDVIARDPAVLAEPTFLSAAAHHRVTPAAYVALRHHPAVPAALLHRLEVDHHDQAFRHTAALANLRQLGRMLDEIGCRWAVVKGPYLASYVHSRPDLRTYLDLDVLIDHARLPEVVARLEADGQDVLDRNWTLIREGERAQVSVLLGGTTPLDLHWHLLNRGPVRHAFHLDVGAMLDRTVSRPLGSVQARVLRDEDALVHLALHSSLSGASRLVWIHDIHALVTRCELDWDVVVESAQAAGASLCLAVLLQRAQATFGTALPEGTLDRLASPRGWRSLTHLLDRFRPVETGFARAYMGRTVIRATRTDLRTSVREIRRTAAHNSVRRAARLFRAPEPPPSVDLLRVADGDLHDRDAFFAAVARAVEL